MIRMRRCPLSGVYGSRGEPQESNWVSIFSSSPGVRDPRQPGVRVVPRLSRSVLTCANLPVVVHVDHGRLTSRGSLEAAPPLTRVLVVQRDEAIRSAAASNSATRPAPPSATG